LFRLITEILLTGSLELGVHSLLHINETRIEIYLKQQSIVTTFHHEILQIFIFMYG